MAGKLCSSCGTEFRILILFLACMVMALTGCAGNGNSLGENDALEAGLGTGVLPAETEKQRASGEKDSTAEKNILSDRNISSGKDNTQKDKPHEEQADKGQVTEKTLADILEYETKSDGKTEYAVITGIGEEYREEFSKYLEIIERYKWDGEWIHRTRLVIPDELDGYEVREIGADAFHGMKISEVSLPEHLRVIGDRAFQDGIGKDSLLWYSYMLELPESLEQIGESAFENCGIFRIEFSGNGDLSVGKRAFADNKNLWAVYFPRTDSEIGEDAFAGCDGEFYLCYGENRDGRQNRVEEYARANGLIPKEIIAVEDKELVINYPEEPFTLVPEIGNFFYGENAWDDAEHAGSWERSEDAPDYGFDEWHAPCGEFCVGEGYIEIEASSELASSDGRYKAENLESFRGREWAWAEGVEGLGIGESITYRALESWHTENGWDGLAYEASGYYDYPFDGYMRYREICIVNGYAKNQKTWEENGRVKTLLMYVEDRPYAYLQLEDTILPQYFKLPPEDIKVADGGEITFRFVIEDVYPGSRYEDTCLTGLVLEFTGRHGH